MDSRHRTAVRNGRTADDSRSKPGRPAGGALDRAVKVFDASFGRATRSDEANVPNWGCARPRRHTSARHRSTAGIRGSRIRETRDSWEASGFSRVAPAGRRRRRDPPRRGRPRRSHTGAVCRTPVSTSVSRPAVLGLADREGADIVAPARGLGLDIPVDGSAALIGAAPIGYDTHGNHPHLADVLALSASAFRPRRLRSLPWARG